MRLESFVTKSGSIPTIIFDVEHGAERKKDAEFKSILQDVRSIAKEICEDCYCIIVVSEANAVFQFGLDTSREQFIFVDEMSFEETKEFLVKRGSKFDDEQVKKIYDNIGGNPGTLKELQRKVKAGKSLDDSINAIIGFARVELGAFKLKPVLKAIKEHPEGVDPLTFRNQKYEGIDMSVPAKVGDAMKETNAIVYRIDKDPPVYQALSTKHKTALKSYEPVIYEERLFPRPALTTPPPQKPKFKFWPF